ncbi:DUF2868 domain-containing protein [Marinimicrobium alkaliphilum]|uniref:DUF2868 domain-containing protein n=1 Tax=Marinimicrobium alkaliphilum TaxID=2202654 RepID=UPI000DB90678|nr:DUF2868 domain-containing protein [Marinimicrobium alkaliphilum]
MANFDAFLSKAPESRLGARWQVARFWPLMAGFNGVLAMNALMLWPSRSGVHLLIFIMTLVLLPFLLMLWTALAGLIGGRAPWWRWLVTQHRDPAINLWSCRQALLAQASFVGSALVWLWLMLISRQMVFYWSTSIEWVSQRVDSLFQVLSLGVITAPRALVISASEAGAITGWETALLSHAAYWGAWLSQVMLLWVIAPALILAGLCHWRMRRTLAHWPDHNAQLRRYYHSLKQDPLRYTALEPAQPDASLSANKLAIARHPLTEPGFGWLQPEGYLPAGSVYLGRGGHKADEQSVRNEGGVLKHWYCRVDQVATGDLADLIQLHSQQCDHPTLILCVPDPEPSELNNLLRSWQTFVERQQLRVHLTVVQPEVQKHG